MQLEAEKDEDGNLMNGTPDGESESKGFFGRLMEKAEEAQKQQR
jgi:hypothetical protein